MADNQPRYTTKRLHDEIAKAKAYARREAFEDAAKIAEFNCITMSGSEIAEEIRKAAQPAPAEHVAVTDEQREAWMDGDTTGAYVGVEAKTRLALKIAPAEQMRATDSFGRDLIERELVSIALRMSRHLQAVDTPAAKKLDAGALDYLRRKGLMPSPLRAEDTVAQSAPPNNQVGGSELLTTIKEFAHWHHLNEVTIAAGKTPSDSEIDFEATAWSRITRAVATAPESSDNGH